MKVSERDLRPGLILYSMPANFESSPPHPYYHMIFIVDSPSQLLMIPSVLSAGSLFTEEAFSASKMLRKYDYYTTWEAALIAAKQNNAEEMSELQLKGNRIEAVIDIERGKHENFSQ